MMTGASHSVAQYRVTDPMKKRVTAVLFCFIRIRTSGLAYADKHGCFPAG